MMFASHLLFSLIVFLFADSFYLNLSGLKFFAGVVVTSVLCGLPDIDTSKSRIGRKHSKVSWVVRRFTKHRGALHSPLVLFLVSCSLVVPLYFLTEKWFKWLIIINIPLQSHAFADFLTERTSFFYPFRKRGLGLFRTGSFSEKVFINGLVILCLGLFYYFSEWISFVVLLGAWVFTLT